jgi:hypothetical protein
MVGMVNPSQNKTLSDYKDRASELSQGVTPGRTSYGGKLVDSSGSNDEEDSTDNDHQGNASVARAVSRLAYILIPLFSLFVTCGASYY